MKTFSFALAMLVASSGALMAQARIVAPLPSGPSVVARPANPSDLTGRSNLQDLTRPGATNSQDLNRR
jgi:hypothetical protein